MGKEEEEDEEGNYKKKVGQEIHSLRIFCCCHEPKFKQKSRIKVLYITVC